MSDMGVDRADRFESPIVVRTRLVPPRLRAETVERPALVTRRLASPARLGVVAGPAGSGKSTLLAQCFDVDPFPAWLSLSEADNDPVSLWWSLITALRTVVGDFGGAYRTRLLAAGARVVDEIVDLMCDELVEHGTPIHLFVDDLHLVDDETCRRSLHRFVSVLPDGVRVTVASRRSEPLPLARLRANGDLVEIGNADLAMSAEDAQLLISRLGADLAYADVERLTDRTEGWPAGLQLAGLALMRAGDAGAFVDAFCGTDRDVADYLIGEVLDSMPDDDHHFMTRTSLLDRLTGDLCDAVTGGVEGAERLARLEQANAFVVALDREGRWYRYHHLFAELLVAELQQTGGDEVPALHARAFEWLRDDGQISEAIPHALAAGETVLAADLVCAHWFGLMNEGRLETVRALLARFEPEDIANHQPLAIAAAFSAAMSGDLRAARRWLGVAERGTYEGPPPDGTASMESSLALTRCSIALDGVDAALADARTAYQLEPPDSAWRLLAALSAGCALVMRGDVGESTEFFEEVERCDDATLRAYALAELSLGQLDRGNASLAATTAVAAIELVRDAGIDDLCMGATAHAARALAALALGDERTARLALRAASRPMESVGQAMPMDSTRSRLLLTRVAIALGMPDVAQRHLDEAQRVADQIEDIGVMRKELAALRSKLPPPGTRVPAGGRTPDLTARELEILQLLRTSLTSREIAQELFLSRNTVQTHVRRLYQKLNASSRAEAVLLADELGLLGDQRSADEAGPTSPR